MDTHTNAVSALTPEQSAFAAKNHNLIYSFAQKSKIDVGEYYDLLAIGLCIAAKLFDPSRGNRFSTLAYRCMFNEYSHFINKEQNISHVPRDMKVSLDDTVPDCTDDLTFIDAVSGSTFDETVVEVAEFAKTVPDKYRGVLLRLVAGDPLKEIAAGRGCSKQNISRVRWILRRSYDDYCAPC